MKASKRAELIARRNVLTAKRNARKHLQSCIMVARWAVFTTPEIKAMQARAQATPNR